MSNTGTSEDIYNLRLHESVRIQTNSKSLPFLDVTRVPGGWLYTQDIPGYSQALTTFVPRGEIHDLE